MEIIITTHFMALRIIRIVKNQKEHWWTVVPIEVNKYEKINSNTKALMSVNDYSINPFDYNDKYSKTNFRG